MNVVKARILEGHGGAISIQGTHAQTRFMPERRRGIPRWTDPLTVTSMGILVFKANGGEGARGKIKSLGGDTGELVVQQGENFVHLLEGQVADFTIETNATVICRCSMMQAPDGRQYAA